MAFKNNVSFLKLCLMQVKGKEKTVIPLITSLAPSECFPGRPGNSLDLHGVLAAMTALGNTRIYTTPLAAREEAISHH